MDITESESTNKPIKVFISYSHTDEAWKDKLVLHLRVLEQAGVDMEVWQDRDIDAGDKWYHEIQAAMTDAAVAVLLISADYLASGFCIKEEVPFLLERQENQGMLLIPVLVRQCAWKAHRWLADRQMLPRDGKCVAIDFPSNQADAVFSDVAERVLDHFTKLAAQPETVATLPRGVPSSGSMPDMGKVPLKSAHIWPILPSEKIDIARLPETGVQLFGRDKELQLLDEMWDSGSANVVSLVAFGGVGKSTLVNRWLQYLNTDNYRGAKRVYGWSFYSQGTGQRVTSADQFISQALTWFGDRNPMEGSPWDKGERLAELIRGERTLLILDGLEPLQSGLDFEKGMINDPALSILVTQLARQSDGLCVVTTREKVAELEQHPNTALQLDLEQISREAGRALLHVGNVQGTDEELEAVSEAFGNHALAVSLLAAYLHRIEGHHISNAACIRDLDIAEAKGKHPRRVMEAFNTRVGESPQTQLLRIVGLFDRPADIEAIEAVKAPPPITGLTDKLQGLPEDCWYDLLDELRECKLLAPKSRHNPRVLDCHPLVREHFGEKLQRENPETWRSAHRRLYEFLKECWQDKPEPTLEDLQPLYQAVVHGCQAGLHQEAMLDVYWPWIQRKLVGYSHRRLGAFGAELAMLSAFFASIWTQPSPNLSDFWQAIVLGFSAARFRSLGRMQDAAELFQGSLVAHRSHGDIWLAGVRARQLADVYTQLGKLTKARTQAMEAVSLGDEAAILADKGVYLSRYQAEGFAPVTPNDIAFERVIQRVAYGEVLFQLGQTREAEQSFCLAERLQKTTWPNLPVLFSIWGARYCRLLLDDILTRNESDSGRYEDIIQRISEMRKTRHEASRMQIPRGNWGPLEEALEQEVIALAKARRSLRQGNGIPLDAVTDIDSAVENLHRTRRQHFICRGLLTRCILRREMKEFIGARSDLDEAWQIAERGSMRLFMADVLLHRARLFREKAALAEAARLIDECGYHRRDGELADAEEAAKGW